MSYSIIPQVVAMSLPLQVRDTLRWLGGYKSETLGMLWEIRVYREDDGRSLHILLYLSVRLYLSWTLYYCSVLPRRILVHMIIALDGFFTLIEMRAVDPFDVRC